MRLPQFIPAGARIVVRVRAGVDPSDGRMKYNDRLGHVVSWDGSTLVLDRDPARNGTRPAERIEIAAADIAILKPVPERR